MPSAIVFQPVLDSRLELRVPNKTETAADHQTPSHDHCAREYKLPSGRFRFSLAATVSEDQARYPPADSPRATQKSHLIACDGFLDYRWCKHDTRNRAPGHQHWCQSPAKSAFQICRSCAAVFSQMSSTKLGFERLTAGAIEMACWGRDPPWL